MLYPRQDPDNNTLLFSCRSCTYSQDADTTCIYRNSLKEEIAETAGNTKDVAEDPTVGDDFRAPPPSASGFGDGAYGDSAMDVDEDRDYYTGGDVVPQMCTLCGQEVTCPFCGQPSENGVLLETYDPAVAAGGDPKKEQEQVEAERKERNLSSAGVAKIV